MISQANLKAHKVHENKKISNVIYAQKLAKSCLNVLFVKTISRANLKGHKVHENEKKPFECKMCSKTFKELFKCTLCEENFTNKLSLK